MLLLGRLGCLILDGDQLQIEHQYRVGRDRRGRALLAISQLAGDVQLVLLTDVHQLQTFDPTRDHATDRQIDQFVYQLYGLSDEEIRIVESATACSLLNAK